MTTKIYAICRVESNQHKIENTMVRIDNKVAECLIGHISVAEPVLNKLLDTQERYQNAVDRMQICNYKGHLCYCGDWETRKIIKEMVLLYDLKRS